MELLNQAYWFKSLGEEYGVNPIICGVIYLEAIPFFTLSITWLVRNYRKGISVVMPVLSASFFFISAYPGFLTKKFFPQQGEGNVAAETSVS